MLRSEFKDQGLLDKIVNLTFEEYRRGSRLSFVAPTWLISEKVTLDDFLEDFESPKQQLDALRDFACMPSTSLRPFFKDPSILITRALPHKRQAIDELFRIADWFIPQAGVEYFIAYDLSVFRDSLGGAMVHREFSPAGDVYVLDWSLQIKTSHAEPVDYECTRNLVRQLKRRGFNIAKLGYDQFQSHDSAMIMGKEGYDVEIVKYHDSLAGCGFLLDLVMLNQFEYGLCDDVFIGEGGELQVINSKRIDHLTSGGKFNSKDTWDAIVNACVLASQQKRPFEREYL